MASRTKILALINFNELKVFESALGQHNMITVLQKNTKNADYSCHQVVADARGAIDQKQLNEILAANSTLALNGDVAVAQLFDGETNYIRFISASSSITRLLQKVMTVAGHSARSLPYRSIRASSLGRQTHSQMEGKVPIGHRSN